MSLGRCCLSFVDVACLKKTRNGWSCLALVDIVFAHIDVHTSRLMRTCIDWCFFLLDNDTWPKSIGLALCFWQWTMQMSPNWCKHTMTDECRTWQMLHFICQLWFPHEHMPCNMCVGLEWRFLPMPDVAFLKLTNLSLQFLLHPAYVYMSQVMRACPGKFYRSLSDIAFYMSTNHVRFLNTFSNASFCWLTFPGRCMKAYTNIAQ